MPPIESGCGGAPPSARPLSAGLEAGGCGLEEDAAAYLLGCLDEDEDARFLAHLPLCQICQEYLESMLPVLQLLEAARSGPRPSGP